MAITNNGTQVTLDESKIPSGYTKPTVTTFDDHEWSRTEEIEITKSTVENSDQSTTMGNIVTAITTQVTTLAADFDATNTVELYSNLRDISTNVAFSDSFYSDTAESYKCTVDIFVKSS